MKDLDGYDVYLVSVSVEDPHAVFVYEEWSNGQTHQASLPLEL